MDGWHQKTTLLSNKQTAAQNEREAEDDFGFHVFVLYGLLPTVLFDHDVPGVDFREFVRRDIEKLVVQLEKIVAACVEISMRELSPPAGDEFAVLDIHRVKRPHPFLPALK